MRFAVIAVLLLSAPLPARCEHALGARQQWQPQVGDTDPRLQQAVEIDVIGRAAVPALALLSEKTGVSLSVAPEDLDTVGERKLTIIAQGCSLKAIMTQIPAALQECHWDIEANGEEPDYLLHRNAGMSYEIARLRQENLLGQDRVARRRLRVEEARAALIAPPQEIGELEQSDLLLARTLRSQEARGDLHAFLALPPQQMQQFLEEGEISIEFGCAPQEVRQAARRFVARRTEWLVERIRNDSAEREAIALELDVSPMEAEKAAREFRTTWLTEHLERSTLKYRDGGTEYGLGIMLWIPLPAGGATGVLAVPPRYPGMAGRDSPFHRLLVTSGTEGPDAALQVLGDWRRRGRERREAERQQPREREWVEPEGAELQIPIALGDQEYVSLTALQGVAARRTGFSVISDYFTAYDACYVPREARVEQPMWRALCCVGDNSGVRCQQIGGCLVFHSTRWYELAQREVPESLILACREKLRAQGHLTLDDVLQLALALKDRPALRPGLALPADLVAAGAHTALYPYNRSIILFLASLTADQRVRAGSAEGLRFRDMRNRQREEVSRIAAILFPDGGQRQVSSAVFHLRESTGQEAGERFIHFDLWFEFPDAAKQARKTWVRLTHVRRGPEGEEGPSE